MRVRCALTADYELVSYEAAYKHDYLGLLRQAWGPGSMSRREFEWWFERNPAGSLMSIAREDGRVVGVAAHSLYRAVLEGEERLLTFSVHATTHDSARGKGVFQALERRHEDEAKRRGAACVLAFASAPTAPLFLGPLGWTEIARYRIWARPLPTAGLSHVARSHLERFEHQGDAAADWPNHLIRDAAYVNWRYLDSPRDYAAFASEDGDAVLGHKVHEGQPIALVADLVGTPRPLLRACLAAVRPGTRLLFALPGPAHRAAYASLGFVPTPKRLHFMGKALAGKLNTDPRAWRFTLGDTDFF
jgi:GNAT superfamily N-acetyltransferase